MENPPCGLWYEFVLGVSWHTEVTAVAVAIISCVGQIKANVAILTVCLSTQTCGVNQTKFLFLVNK